MSDHSLISVPEHVAIIMDGNGRWANARGLPRSMGHRKGVEAVRETVRAAGDMGIKYLTLFAFPPRTGGALRLRWLDCWAC